MPPPPVATGLVRPIWRSSRQRVKALESEQLKISGLQLKRSRSLMHPEYKLWIHYVFSAEICTGRILTARIVELMARTGRILTARIVELMARPLTARDHTNHISNMVWTEASTSNLDGHLHSTWTDTSIQPGRTPPSNLDDRLHPTWTDPHQWNTPCNKASTWFYSERHQPHIEPCKIEYYNYIHQSQTTIQHKNWEVCLSPVK